MKTNNRSIALADKTGKFLVQQDAVLPIYSLTKPFIAGSIFAAGIDIHEPISTWIDKTNVPRATDITVEHLLNHTSGIRDYHALSDYMVAVRSGQAPWSDRIFTQHTLHEPLLFEPGSGWAYSNPGYWLLAQIVQKAVGANFDDVLQRLIIGPLDLKNTRVAHGLFAPDLPDYPAEWVWHGLLMSTASDVVQFMRSSLVTPLLQHAVSVPDKHLLMQAPHYGYGLMVEPYIKYGHNGEGPRYSASCFHFVKQGVTGCVLASVSGTEENVAMKILHEVIARRSKP